MLCIRGGIRSEVIAKWEYDQREQKASWVVAVKLHGLARRDQPFPHHLRLCLRQKYQKFRIFQSIAPGFALRRCPRANKNLHMASGHASAPGFVLRRRPRANKNLHIPSGHASGNFLHAICPQGDIMQIFLAHGIA
ncbi:hypothetical protein T4D_7944 [Trichinella pseudospiralis]|uniref:Uncharacterized protein n=1 Tax=Trichinella pseudospiralis TaxID=6337 RepID=A0A0V1FT73_TRIPS|nr:hypothetical protein T4D_7944 [Trichinella pseudospiralis]